MPRPLSACVYGMPLLHRFLVRRIVHGEPLLSNSRRSFLRFDLFLPFNCFRVKLFRSGDRSCRRLDCCRVGRDRWNYAGPIGNFRESGRERSPLGPPDRERQREYGRAGDNAENLLL